MKNNSKKYEGFTLIEVVICIAILAIVSIGLYDGCVFIAKQIKAGQVKQTAALEGKKIIETMKATNFGIPSGNDALSLGNNIDLPPEIDASGNIFYARYLDGDFKPCNKAVSKYQEKVTISPAKAYETPQTTGQSVELDTNGELNSQSDKLYISKIGSQDCMRYWEYNANTPYAPVNDSSTVPIPSNSAPKIEMSVYFSIDVNGYQNINIKDYEGYDLLSINKKTTTDKDLVINFSNYVDSNGLIPTGANIELDVYNKTTDIPKIYIEKSQELNVDVEARKGEINIYDNRSEDPKEDDFGELYDITLEINEGKNNLFTGYCKKNIHQ
ncbi:type II secretion system protein [Clostridium sp.]|uniref:type II secretion system protein n=1 Tax=Clostridium sp. TaxID=1506 RepID=UPI002609F4AA|nr:prepilin-type N-terminal cleavage/methylation domain-containing protein [Clostridium sp.]